MNFMITSNWFHKNTLEDKHINTNAYRGRGGLVVERSRLVNRVPGSIPAPITQVLKETNNLCVDFLGVLQFPASFLILSILPPSFGLSLKLSKRFK